MDLEVVQAVGGPGGKTPKNRSETNVKRPANYARHHLRCIPASATCARSIAIYPLESLSVRSCPERVSGMFLLCCCSCYFLTQDTIAPAVKLCIPCQFLRRPAGCMHFSRVPGMSLASTLHVVSFSKIQQHSLNPLTSPPNAPVGF